MSLDPARSAVRAGVRRVLADAVADGMTPGPVVVACSGGADSLALVAAAVFEARRARAADPGWRVVGATVDHGLQEGSAAQADRVVAQLTQLGVDEAVSMRVHVDPTGLGVEAAARQARYAALNDLAEHWSADLILTGHTRDDQAETVLMGLTRGSGGRSLAGMHRAHDRVRRPLLDVTRAETEAPCRADDLSWWVDPHNSDPRFLRARLRHDVMPLLEDQLGPGVAAALARTADQVRDDVDLLDTLASDVEAQARRPDGWSVPRLREAHPALLSRVVRSAALQSGAVPAELFAVHIDALVALVRGQLRGAGGGVVKLPGHVVATRAGDVLTFASSRLR